MGEGYCNFTGGFTVTLLQLIRIYIHYLTLEYGIGRYRFGSPSQLTLPITVSRSTVSNLNVVKVTVSTNP